MDKVKKDFVSLIEKKSPKFTIISQYISHFFRTNGITFPDYYSQILLNSLKDWAIDKFNVTEIHHYLIDHPDRWLYIERK